MLYSLFKCSIIYLDAGKLDLHCELEQGSFAKVYKAFWRGTVVAAKVIPAARSAAKSIEKELSVYRYWLRVGAIFTLDL